MSDENKNANDEFWDTVGEETDPVKHFIKRLSECGADVEIIDNRVKVRNACEKLHYHEAGKYKELFCDECGISISVDNLVNLDDDINDTESTDENDPAPQTKELSDLDEFMQAVETGVGDYDYDSSMVDPSQESVGSEEASFDYDEAEPTSDDDFI